MVEVQDPSGALNGKGVATTQTRALIRTVGSVHPFYKTCRGSYNRSLVMPPCAVVGSNKGRQAIVV